MPNHNYHPSVCKLCGGSVDPETGLELAITRGGVRTEAALCEACATIECGQCGTHVSLRSILDGSSQKRATHERIECSRCGESVRATDAAEIRHTKIKEYRKRVCGDCLQKIGVTGDYRVVREFTPS